jgi:hypothetical protein
MYEGQTETYLGLICNFVIKGYIVDIYYLNILYDLKYRERWQEIGDRRSRKLQILDFYGVNQQI